jgi:hypothetical protein
MRYRLSEIKATGPQRFSALRLFEAGVAILVIHNHILQTRVLKSPEISR